MRSTRRILGNTRGIDETHDTYHKEEVCGKIINNTRSKEVLYYVLEIGKSVVLQSGIQPTAVKK